VKISPVVSAENRWIEIALRVQVAVRHISSNISGCTGPIFAIFSLYESALHASDGTVLPICQGTLPHCHGNQLKSKNRPISFVALPFWNRLEYHNFDFKVLNRMNFSTLCTILVTLGQVIPEITRLTYASCWTRQRKSAYLTEYLSNY